MANTTAGQRLAKLRAIEPEEIIIVEPEAEPWKKFLAPVDKTPVNKLPSVIPAGDQEEVGSVQELLHLAINMHYKIMKDVQSKLKCLPSSEVEEYIPLAKLGLATAQSALNTQIKVDENQLRARKQDDILTILKELKDEERKQATLELALSE